MEAVLRIAGELKDKPGALIPILHGIQDELGYVPPEAVPVIADVLNLTRAEVHGVVTFYHDFRSEAPRPSHPEDLPGGILPVHWKRRADQPCEGASRVDFHHTTKDNKFTLEPVYCLGNCALSPAVMLDGEVHGRVTAERFNSILKELGDVRGAK